MIKSEFVSLLATKYDMLAEQDVAKSVNLLLGYISDALAEGRRAEARGFGSFSVTHRKPRLAHNPKTLVKLKVPSKYSVHFKPGKEMRERVNESRRHLPIVVDNREE
jgi:integration host factor subunit beta